MTGRVPCGNLALYETRKKSAEFPRRASGGAEGYSLEAFRDRLRDLCGDHIEGDGDDRTRRSKDEAEQAVACARQHGLLIAAAETWGGFCEGNADLHFGTEHVVESDEESARMAKITVPPKFGLIPKLVTHSVPNLRGEPGVRRAIEFVPATPLEYLDRWIAANDVFGDDVRLTSVVRWADGQVSFAISQPQYAGEPATEREIDRFFEAAGWRRILDGSQHVLFYNYAFQVLAIDALPRNCYLNENGLQPFDVILCHPGEVMEDYLGLYPGIGKV